MIKSYVWDGVGGGPLDLGFWELKLESLIL